MRKMVLLVCTGNTCRSVMAQGIFQEILRELGEEDRLRVASAGMAAVQGGEASPEALRVLEERGIHIGRHRSRPVTEDLLSHAHLVLTMTGGQRDAIKGIFPQAAGKVFALKEYGGHKGDIEDPIGMPLQEYRRTAGKLEKALLKAAKRVLEEGET